MQRVRRNGFATAEYFDHWTQLNVVTLCPVPTAAKHRVKRIFRLPAIAWAPDGSAKSAHRGFERALLKCMRRLKIAAIKQHRCVVDQRHLHLRMVGTEGLLLQYQELLHQRASFRALAGLK